MFLVYHNISKGHDRLPPSLCHPSNLMHCQDKDDNSSLKGKPQTKVSLSR